MTLPIVERVPTLIHVPGKPLGRNKLVNWRDIARHLPRTEGIAFQSVSWAPTNPMALDQLDLGACTGFAAADVANTAPYGLHLTAEDARGIYSDATERDPFPGSWPPDDTGSTGWAAFSAATDLGCFPNFAMAAGLDEVLEALQTRPGAIGIDWYENCDDTDGSGRIRPTGRIRGGHEVEVLAVDTDLRRVWIRNSWGPLWGFTLGDATGCAWFSFDDLSALLESGGDATFPDAPLEPRGGMGVELSQKQTRDCAFAMREAFRGAWRRLLAKEASEPSLCVLLSQWALETGRGASCWNWNLGNQKYPSGLVKRGDELVETIPLGSRGDWQWYPAGEIDAKGKPYTIYPPNRGACWGAYRTLSAGMEAYFGLLRRRYLPAWPYIEAGDAKGFSRRLKQLGYYTASEAVYTKSLVSLANEFARMPLSLRLGEPGSRLAGRGNVVDGIKRWQQIVGVAQDGKFGALTERATVHYQETHGLATDGIAGPQTWSKAIDGP
jgi:peptidoglycan hydrolase-like protein with peptidoglycan-binding domain